MSSKKGNKGDEPENDPYDILGIKPGLPDTAINKAYRKLALKLHPDKQSGLSPQEAERVAKEFHNVKEARAFLLESEFREARIKYDAKRASILQRKKADAQRDLSMNERRKRMRDELKQREAEAMSSSSQKKRAKTSSKTGRKQDDDLIEKLRREGNSMRQAYAEKEAQAAASSAQDQIRKEKINKINRERLLQDRQVRMKWSRKKMTTSPSEHSLATLLSRFGSVEEVEMLGSKGNLALITFANPSSCFSCVEAYKSSEEMRASYVGKRKEEEEAKSAKVEQEEENLAAAQMSARRSQNNDTESLCDRQLRQATERERLLREMEAESGETTSGQRATGKATSATSDSDSANLSSRSVSVQFPSTEGYRGLSPVLKLAKAENDILGQLLSREAMDRLAEIQS